MNLPSISMKTTVTVLAVACLAFTQQANGQDDSILLVATKRYQSLDEALKKPKKVEELLLYDQNLSELPPEIGRLVNLRELNVMDNKLTALPPEIGRLVKLEDLSIQRNQLTEIPTVIRNFEQLRVLYIAGNKISEVPSWIGELSNLEKLYLSDNLLAELPASIGRLVNLQILDLAGNQLTALPPEIAQLTSLKVLDVGGNQLTELPPELAGIADRPGQFVMRYETAEHGVNRVYGGLYGERPLFRTEAEIAAVESLSPVERAAQLINYIDSIQAGKRPDGPEIYPADFYDAKQRLAEYLETNPEDVRTPILFARVGVVVIASQPTAIVGGEIPSSEDEYAPLRAALDKALELEPNNAEAHYWQARYYGRSGPASTDDGLLTYKTSDLDQALIHASRAVELEPDNRWYREALAIYLVNADRNMEAMEVLRDLDGGKHLVYLLLSDLEALPIPATAKYLSFRTMEFADLQMNRRRFENHPYLRVRIYAFPGSASELEVALRQYWPKFKLIEATQEQMDEGSVTRRFKPHLLYWKKGSLKQTRSTLKMAMKGAEGIQLGIIETQNPTDQMREKWDMPSADPFCVLFFQNSRSE